MKGWVCVRWWKMTFQCSADAGSVPSSGSIALPAIVIKSPARNVAPFTGCEIVSVGRRPTSTTAVAVPGPGDGLPSLTVSVAV